MSWCHDQSTITHTITDGTQNKCVFTRVARNGAIGLRVSGVSVQDGTDNLRFDIVVQRPNCRCHNRSTLASTMEID
jgi:hypothetical protein